MTITNICLECGQPNGNHLPDCVTGKMEDRIDCYRSRSREYED